VKIAVVTIVRGRHAHLVAQQRSLLHGSRQPTVYVVVSMGDPELAPHLMPELEGHVVDIPADPQRLPLAAARNLGAGRAFDEGADAVIMLDVDCLAGHDLVHGYAECVATEPSIVWSGPVTYLPPAGPQGYDVAALAELDDPHPARPAPPPGDLVRGASPDLFWSLSFVAHHSAWEIVGGFCEEYAGYGAEDTDFGHSVISRGAELGWAGTPRAYHQHHTTFDPPVQHLDDILRNGQIFHSRWGRWPMEGWLRDFERMGLVERHGDTWCRTR
jgi:N-acetylglucosaminyl-diphospho-decaprenol L-rhamnosyltransferase